MSDLDEVGRRDGEELIDSASHILGQRILVIRAPDGSVFLRLVSGDAGLGVLDPFTGQRRAASPSEIWVSAPFGGTVVHLQIDMIPAAGAEGLEARVVLVTREGTDERPKLVIRIYDKDGAILSEYSREAEFHLVLATEAEGRKAILTRVVDALVAMILDLRDGRVLREGKIGRVEDEFAKDIVDLQLLGFAIVIVQRFRDDTWVRLTLIGADGRVLHVIEIPGRFLAGTGNGKDGKVIATEKDGDVYQDLVVVHDLVEPEAEDGAGEDGAGEGAGDDDEARQASPTDVRGHAENPVKGWFLHQQHDRTDDGDRWVLVVYDPDRDETTIRILGPDGRPTATIVLNGRPPRVEGPDDRIMFFATFERIDHNTKVFAVERGGETEVTRIDLRSGRTRTEARLAGSFEGFRHSEDGDLEVETRVRLRALIGADD